MTHARNSDFGPAAGGAAPADPLGWKTVLDARDLTAFADHDFKAGGPGDIGGVDWTLYNPSKVASMVLSQDEIDGGARRLCLNRAAPSPPKPPRPTSCHP